MDLLLIAIVTIVLLAATFASLRYATRKTRESARQKLEDSLIQPAVVHTQELSIYDIFWDLGATEQALKFMATQQILPTTSHQTPLAFGHLNHLITQHGSYEDFIAKSLLEIEQDSPTTTATTENNNENYLLAHTLQDRQHFRITRKNVHDVLTIPPYIYADTRPDITDITQLDASDTDAILALLFTGNLDTAPEKRHLSSHLSELHSDVHQRFSRFYNYYGMYRSIAHRNTTHGILKDLHALNHAWVYEETLMNARLHDRPWNQQRWANSADILVTHALENIFQLAHHAATTTDVPFTAITELAHNGHTQLAGYLLYLNRHHIYTKKLDYTDLEDGFETIAYFIHTELRKVLQKQAA